MTKRDADAPDAGLGCNAWRAIDLQEQDTLDPAAFRALVQEAAALNAASADNQTVVGSAGPLRIGPTAPLIG